MRGFLFVSLQLLLLPVTAIGIAVYGLRLSRLSRGAGVSATSFEPLLLRALLHCSGVREDAMAWDLLRHGPMGGWALGCVMKPPLWAAAVSGFRGSVFRFPPRLPSSMGALVHHRTMFFDAVVKERVLDGVQLVVLGAGWDSRGYAPTIAGGATVFEVDLPAIQEQKRATLRAVGLNRGGPVGAGEGVDETRGGLVRFVPVDLGTESWVEAASRQGFDPNRDTVVIWEGVSYYLQPSAVASVVEEIGRRLPRGVLAFDFPGLALVEARSPFRWRGRMLQSVLRWFREPWLCGFEMSPEPLVGVAPFLRSAGLRLVRSEVFGVAAPLGGILEAQVMVDPGPAAGG